jgi:HSP20 family molecular chaperone IbpA
VKAGYKDGILEVRLPTKVETAPPPSAKISVAKG